MNQIRDGYEPDEIEITPAMIEAGIYEAKEHALGMPLSELVRSVFVAMVTEQRSAQPQQPSL